MTREQGVHMNVPHLHTLVSQDTFIKNTNWIRQFISHYSIVYLPLLYVKDKGRNQIEEKGKLLSPQMSNSSSAQFKSQISVPKGRRLSVKRAHSNRVLSNGNGVAHKCNLSHPLLAEWFIFLSPLSNKSYSTKVGFSST